MGLSNFKIEVIMKDWQKIYEKQARDMFGMPGELFGIVSYKFGQDLEEGKDYEVISSTLNKNPNESVQMEGNEHQDKVLHKPPHQIEVRKTKDH